MKFQEYVEQKDTPQMVDPRQPFANVGMQQNNVGNTMTSLRRLFTQGGVAQDPDEKAAMRRMINLLRSVIRRLMSMGMTADDLLMVFQSITTLVTNHGGTANTGFNQGRVSRELRAATADQE